MKEHGWRRRLSTEEFRRGRKVDDWIQGPELLAVSGPFHFGLLSTEFTPLMAKVLHGLRNGAMLLINWPILTHFIRAASVMGKKIIDAFDSVRHYHCLVGAPDMFRVRP